MMESTDLRDSDDPARLCCLNGARLGCILLQGQMRTTPMIVVYETTQVPPKTLCIEHDHMVQALASDRANDPFDVSALLRRARCRKHLLDAHRLDLVDKVLPEDPIAIPQQKLRRCLPRKRFA
jgi:hypothetical protein